MDENTKTFIINNLSSFKKPARYIGGEINSVVKRDSKIKVGLCYPDLYEVGMGNLAIKILYEKINQHPDFSAERVFAPFLDFEDFLRKNNIKLYTLETFTYLKDLDVLAITIPYELVYTNILNIIDLGGIPLHSKDREYPLVIGGGPILNPEPLSSFFDGFFIGEADTAIIEILEKIRDYKGIDKIELLKRLEGIEGFYSPLLHEIKYEKKFFVKNFNFTIKKRVEDINNVPSCFNFPIPWFSVYDKEGIEIARGCYHRCRFCNSTVFYKPVRERSIKDIEKAVEWGFYKNGVLEFSLLSLSSADYSKIGLLLDRLNEKWSKNYVSFYLPSLKVNSFSLGLLEKLKSVKKTGLTLAIECGQKYRKAINKDVSDEKLFDIINEARDRGWDHVKIYLMIGFFDLEDEKIEIIELIKSFGSFDMIFNISLNLFVPKPFTPFERKKLYRPDEVEPVFKEIKKFSKRFRNIKLSYSDPYASYIEGVLARGSRETSKIIEDAFKAGLRLDGWDEFLNKDVWFKIFDENKEIVDEINESYNLPWHFINPLVSLEFIKKEENRSVVFESSPSCDDGCKDFCGACTSIKNTKASNEFYDYDVPVLFKDEYKVIASIVFEKKGSLVYLSSIDILKLFERVLVRARLPLVFTTGFNPKIRLEFGFISPVGFESEYENVRIFLHSDDDSIKEKIEEASSGLIKIRAVKKFYSKPESLQSLSKYFVLSANKFLLDKYNLLSFIDNSDFFENEKGEIVFRIKCGDFKVFKEKLFYMVKRLKVLDKDFKEVL